MTSLKAPHERDDSPPLTSGQDWAVVTIASPSDRRFVIQDCTIAEVGPMTAGRSAPLLPSLLESKPFKCWQGSCPRNPEGFIQFSEGVLSVSHVGIQNRVYLGFHPVHWPPLPRTRTLEVTAGRSSAFQGSNGALPHFQPRPVRCRQTHPFDSSRFFHFVVEWPKAGWRRGKGLLSSLPHEILAKIHSPTLSHISIM